MECVVTYRAGAVQILRLNRPEKLNALNKAVIGVLSDTLRLCELQEDVRAIVITGTGRAFSAGADIEEFEPHIHSGPNASVANFMRPGHALTRQIERYPKPVIAAVNGLAYGGGCELVESCHMAIASETAVFSKSEINIGIIPTFGGTQRLPRNVGRKAALGLILTGRTFTAKEALRLGLINHMVPDGSSLESALDLARAVAQQPPATIAAALSAVHRGMDASIDDGLMIEESEFRSIIRHAETKEGIRAFLEKRKPRFIQEQHKSCI